MLRRKKDSEINGESILNLTKRTVHIVACEFDASEYLFYTKLEGRISNEVDRLQRSGEQGSKYMHYLVLLLRLRQGR